jgi:hypothetical protein
VALRLLQFQGARLAALHSGPAFGLLGPVPDFGDQSRRTLLMVRDVHQAVYPEPIHRDSLRPVLFLDSDGTEDLEEEAQADGFFHVEEDEAKEENEFAALLTPDVMAKMFANMRANGVVI